MQTAKPSRTQRARAGHAEALLDDALRMTFPASDPIAPAIATVPTGETAPASHTANHKTKTEARMTTCTHRDQIKPVQPRTDGCEECLKSGDPWVHLRLCLTCGHVGCCDSSINKHATKHFHATRHPIMRSIEPGESWMWCYVDEVMLT
jgi:uncharacterized UBP type Zn finger protein